MPLPVRPVLKPALRQVWRDPATLQLGLAPRHAVVLEGLQACDAQLLRLLDGSRDVATLFADANDAGCGPARAARLIELLHAADVLDEAPGGDPRLGPDQLSLSLVHRGVGSARRVLERRRQARVSVHGAGRVGASLVGLLVAAGIATIDVLDDKPVRPGDLSPAGIREQGAGDRATATAGTWRARHRGVRAATSVRDGDLHVVAPVSATPPPEVLAGVRRRPHLLVVVRETTASVGPLVIPGRTPCLRCLQLARADRDPRWGELSAQLVGGGRSEEPCDVTLATLAASLAAMQTLAHLDASGRPATVGGVIEFDLVEAALRRRSVPAHPACGCGAGSAEATMTA